MCRGKVRFLTSLFLALCLLSGGAPVWSQRVVGEKALVPMSEEEIRARVVGKQLGAGPWGADDGPTVLYPNGIAVQFGGFTGQLSEPYLILGNEIRFGSGSGGRGYGLALFKSSDGRVFSRSFVGDTFSTPVPLELVELTAAQKNYLVRQP